MPQDDAIDFRCPFCSAAAQVVAGELPHVLHGVPACKEFEEKDVVEYLTAVNNAFAGSAGVAELRARRDKVNGS